MKNSTKTHQPLTARLSWKNNQPFSETFEDIYFSPQDGLAETQYVFLEGNDLKKRWENLPPDSSQHFTIIETGFGTGLNFLACWELWDKTAPQGCRLHYISVEKFPLSKQDIRQALSDWPQLSEKVSKLVSHYPPNTSGIHRVTLAEGRVHLSLIWGDAQEVFHDLHAQADAWFLDGFAPSKNPDMWSTSLFEHMVRLSRNTTTFSTFTAASMVRKNLIVAGFKVQKRKGYKYKREMLVGHLENHQKVTQCKPQQKPWFINGQNHNKNTKTALVIGGGIAGASSAYALSRHGFKVELIERTSKLASAASGNPTGVLFTKLNPEFSYQNHFFQQSYFHAIRHLQDLKAQKSAAEFLQWQQCGLLQLNFSEKEKALQHAILSSNKWPEDVVQAVSAQQASEISGISQSNDGLFLPQSGWVDPASLCKALLSNKDSIRVRYHQQAIQLLQDNDRGWKVFDENEKVITSSDIIVIANSVDAINFSQSNHLPLTTIRGQISFSPTTEESSALKTIINYDGYATPGRNGYHCIGATFHPNDPNTDIREQDHKANLEQLNRANPDLYNILNSGANKRIEGRTAFRCQTPDNLPVVGPLPIFERFLQDYAGLRTGRLKEGYPIGTYYQGLYINTAFGSRGLTSAPLCSEILLSHITGEPQPIEKDIVHALHPARFIIRDIKRCKI